MNQHPVKALRPTKSNFPRSWKRWRALKAGEALRFTDRVITVWHIRKRGLVKHTRSFQLGRDHVGEVVSHGADCYPVGWYFRRIN